LSNILRDHVENETKIKYALELDTFDVIINKDILNYIEHEEKPQPAKEIIDFNRFNVDQLKILLEEFKLFSVNLNFIRKSVFIDMMIKRYVISFI